MGILKDFLHVFIQYWQDLWLMLGLGFVLSGVLYKFIPTSVVERHLGEKGIRSILLSSLVGTILPICCFGTLPIAMTLKRKGASLGSVLAFLVATPATSVSALIVCWKLLGGIFTIAIFLAVNVMAIVLGVICNGIQLDLALKFSGPQECCPGAGCAEGAEEARKGEGGKLKFFLENMKGALEYAFIILPKEIGVEIFLGIAVASFISVFQPLQQFISAYLTGVMGYFFILAAGLVTYVCSTASVPLADALLKSGMSQGQALCYLLAGPVTSYGAILVIKKDFGWKILMLYLGVISAFSLASGVLFDIIMSRT